MPVLLPLTLPIDIVLLPVTFPVALVKKIKARQALTSFFNLTDSESVKVGTNNFLLLMEAMSKVKPQ